MAEVVRTLPKLYTEADAARQILLFRRDLREGRI